MEKNTKLIIGLGLGAVALYLIFKPKGSTASTNVNQAALTKCELEYSRMARPAVVQTPEYWKKREEEFMKNCLQEEYIASKEALFNSTIRFRGGAYQIENPEGEAMWKKQLSEAQAKIDQLGLRKEYEEWLNKRQELMKNAPLPQ
jgi:hypothetical protein